ncbi:hypothetical protein BDV06DRAFT_191457 [Aspergillus oleicola]
MPWLLDTAPVLHSATVITEVFLPSSMVGYIVCHYSPLKRDYHIPQTDRSLALDFIFSILNFHHVTYTHRRPRRGTKLR